MKSLTMNVPELVANERKPFEAACEKLDIPANSEVAWKLWQACLAQHQSTHPDTARLNHLILWDRYEIGHIDGDERYGTTEKIEFVFENLTGGDALEAVRAAIDRSMGV